MAKDRIKNADEQPDEMVRRVMSWEGAQSFHALWAHCLHMFTNPQALNPVLLGFVWRHDWLLILFPSPLLSPENRGWG